MVGKRLTIRKKNLRRLSLKKGGNGCTSYNVNVSSNGVAGQPIVTGNPVGCLDKQLMEVSRFSPSEVKVKMPEGNLKTQNNLLNGGGASCSGVGFDLSDMIAGRPVVTRSSPNCEPGTIVTRGGGKKRYSKNLKKTQKPKKVKNSRKTKKAKKSKKNKNRK